MCDNGVSVNIIGAHVEEERTDRTREREEGANPGDTDRRLLCMG